MCKRNVIFLFGDHFFFLLAWEPPSRPWPPPHSRGFLWFLDHTQRHTTVGRTPLDEWSARRRDLYLTTHNIHNRQTSMPPGGIRTHDLSRRAAVDLRLRPRGHWDRRFWYPEILYFRSICNNILIYTNLRISILSHSGINFKFNFIYVYIYIYIFIHYILSITVT